MTNLTNLQGNHACALGAVAAGCRFYAGYPITPSSEVAERMSVELPKVDGVFIQMEDEIASMAAVLGASAGGVKAMTATSGPGFSLKQENLGYAAAAEVPCVVVNVMRGGPSTGMPTRPAQGDIMQARWGTHGDHPVIALAPASVAEVYTETQRAFSLSESLRVPVMILYDETIGHLVESVDLDAAAAALPVSRKFASGDPAGFVPYAVTDDLVPPMPRPGDGYRTHMTGLTHAESGFPTQDPDTAQRAVQRLLDKVELHRERIDRFEAIDCGGAEVVIAAYGIGARAARAAKGLLDAAGIRAGLFRPITLWPFPEQAFRRAAEGSRLVLCPEMNAGQLVLELERLAPAGTAVAGLNRFDGEPIAPDAIAARVKELLNDA
jgi:2-oxoglutarate ferredoxin oxidoreductase subunit alpha